MKARKYIELTAIFLIFLILTLPIAIASELRITFIGGTTNNVDGYVTGSEDTLKASVEAKLDTSEVTKDKIKLGQVSFDSCQNSLTLPGFKTCTINYPLAGISVENENNWQIIMNDNGNTIYPIGSSKTRIDSIAPGIEFSVLPSVASPSQEITINYNIQDYAFDSDTSKCSGIKKLEFYNKNTGAKFKTLTTDVVTEPDDCSKTGAFTIQASLISSLEGTIEIEAKAYDNFNHLNSGFSELRIDSTPPNINTGSFMFADSAGNKINWIASNGINAKAFVNITSNDTNVSSVRADFPAALNPENPIGVRPASSCNWIAGKYVCEWDNINLKMDMSFDGNIPVTASDIYGNTITQNIHYTINFDNTQPIISSIETSHKTGSQSYIGAERNDIIVKIDDAGAGFNNRNIWMNFDSQGNKKPDNCAKTGNFWYCYWNNMQTAKDSGTVNAVIDASSSDDAGNILTGTNTADFIVDKIKPVIESVVSSPDALTSDDTLTITATIIEMNNVSMTINASGISSSNSLFTGTCTTDSETKTCTVEINNIVSFYTTIPVLLTVTDSAGNTETASKDITVYELDESGTPNFFTVSSINTIPSNIDKGVMSKIAMNIFVSPSINPITPTTAVVAAENIDCSQMMGSLDYEQEPYIMNTGLNPIVVMKTNTFYQDSDTFNVSCVLSMKIRNGNKVYRSFETENITVNIPMSGLAMGEIDENAQKKIDSANNEIAAVEKEIASKENLLSTLGTFCSIARMMGQINGMLQGLKAAMNSLTSALYSGFLGCCSPTPAGAYCCAMVPKIWAMWVKICNPLAKFHQTVESYIWPSGAFPTGKDTVGFIVKYACMISMECVLCSADAWANLAGGLITASLGPKLGDKIYGTSERITYTPLAGYTPTFEDIYAGDTTNFIKSTSQESYSTKEKWQNTPLQTSAPGDSGNWIWDPYKSIHYAKACMCIPAEAYNLKKDKQIKCMYRNCLIDTMTKGVPSTPCEEMYKERECLYFEGAQYKRGQGIMDFFSAVFKALLGNLPFLIAGIIYKAQCLPNEITPEAFCLPAPPAAQYTVFCGLMGGANVIMELKSLLNSKFSFNNYNQELGGLDYCSDTSQY